VAPGGTFTLISWSDLSASRSRLRVLRHERRRLSADPFARKAGSVLGFQFWQFVRLWRVTSVGWTDREAG